MLVVLKFMTVKNVFFQINADENDLIFDIKQKVYVAIGEGYEAENLRLVFLGQILNDNKPVSYYNTIGIGNGRILVINYKNTYGLERNRAETFLLKHPHKAYSINVPNIFLPANHNEVIKYIVSLGISEIDAQRSLEMCNYDPNAALHNLLQISCGTNRLNILETPSNHLETDIASYLSKEDDSSLTSEEKNHKMLRSIQKSTESFYKHPLFKQICEQIGSNPYLFTSMATELQKYSPKILEEILLYPTEFYKKVIEHYHKEAHYPQESDLISKYVDQDTLNQFADNLNITEKDVIEKICSMGHQRDDVIKAFYYCDKDENLTIEYLLNKINIYLEEYDNEFFP